MRFMMIMLPAAKPADFQPDPAFYAEMMKYNEALTNAGALISLDGLQPVTAGALISRAGDGRKVETEFTGSGIGGYWVIQTATKDEAIDWARKAPIDHGDRIELRQIFEMEDFGAEIQDAVKDSREVVEAGLAAQKG